MVTVAIRKWDKEMANKILRLISRQYENIVTGRLSIQVLFNAPLKMSVSSYVQ